MEPGPPVFAVPFAAPSRPCRPLEHPFENTVILQELFLYCSANLDTVKSIRLVNKTWKDACASVWKSHTIPLKIISDRQERKQHQLDVGTCTPLSHFLQQRRSSQSKPPLRNCHLQFWKIYNKHFIPPSEDEINVGIERRFWNQHGTCITVLKLQGCFLDSKLFDHSFLSAVPNMKTLILKNCVFGSKGKLRVRLSYEKKKWQVIEERHRLRGQYPTDRPLLVWESTKVAQRIREALCLPHHGNLKSLQLDNVGQKECGSARIFWYPLIVMFSNLEHISLGRGFCDASQVNELIGALDGSMVTHTLRQLDFTENLNYYGDPRHELPNTNLSFDWKQLKLTKMRLDLGLKTSREQICRILVAQANTLKKLHLHRLPLSEFFTSFPCPLVMPRLTELNLQGNPCGNLDFLTLMPNLKVLKWNSDFCNENGYGSRLYNHQKLKRSPQSFSLFNGKLVENTKHLEEDFKLKYLETLEMECGPISVQCWKRLGKWLPNLKTLKGNVGGDKELEVIAEQWLAIESLEFSHGSKVSAQGILDVVLTDELFKKLQSFVWKPCPCTEVDVGEEESLKQSFTEHILRKKIGNHLVVPWIGKQEKLQKMACTSDLLEKALTSCGDGQPFLNLLQVNEIRKKFSALQS